MGETPKTAPVVAHGGNPQDRAAFPRPRCIAFAKTLGSNTETPIISLVE
ncbi:hypothetical protein [Moorena sp. SIO4G3]|nr:hypothetical protein [Moorena sp. SIO4G3]NEO80146.1 hypothetical protein [Moorena sp. SIO4G3]